MHTYSNVNVGIFGIDPIIKVFFKENYFMFYYMLDIVIFNHISGQLFYFPQKNSALLLVPCYIF